MASPDILISDSEGAKNLDFMGHCASDNYVKEISETYFSMVANASHDLLIRIELIKTMYGK